MIQKLAYKLNISDKNIDNQNYYEQNSKNKRSFDWCYFRYSQSLEPEAVQTLKNVDLKVHAGDFCKQEIIEKLRKTAPVYMVKANNDKGARADDIPIYKVNEIEETLIYVIHDIKEMNI